MRIKELLEHKKMSQNMLSHLARVPQSSLSLIVNGKLHPCPAWRKRIADSLGVTESEIFQKEVKIHDTHANN